MGLFDKAKDVAATPEAQDLLKKAEEMGKEALSNIAGGNKPKGEQQLDEAKETAEEASDENSVAEAAAETAGNKPSSDKDEDGESAE
jgi:hypothetical protein